MSVILDDGLRMTTARELIAYARTRKKWGLLPIIGLLTMPRAAVALVVAIGLICLWEVLVWLG